MVRLRFGLLRTGFGDVLDGSDEVFGSELHNETLDLYDLIGEQSLHQETDASVQQHRVLLEAEVLLLSRDQLTNHKRGRVDGVSTLLEHTHFSVQETRANSARLHSEKLEQSQKQQVIRGDVPKTLNYTATHQHSHREPQGQTACRKKSGCVCTLMEVNSMRS